MKGLMMFSTHFSCGLVVPVLLVGSLMTIPHSMARTSVPADPVEIATQLLELREIRSLSFKEDAEDEFIFAGDRPGLVLTFQTQLPQNRKLISLDQPESVVSTDSTGADLGDIEANIIGEQTWVEIKTIYTFSSSSSSSYEPSSSSLSIMVGDFSWLTGDHHAELSFLD